MSTIMRAIFLSVLLVLTISTLHSQGRQIHKDLVGNEFDLLDQPFYCDCYQTMSAKQISETQYIDFPRLLITYWSASNQESIRQYKKYLSVKGEYEKLGLLIIGVCIDEDKAAWKDAITANQLENKWNCIVESDEIKETIEKRKATLTKDNRDYLKLLNQKLFVAEHIKKTSIPLTILINEGKIAAASETELAINSNINDPSLDETTSWIAQKINLYTYKTTSYQTITLGGIEYKIGEAQVNGSSLLVVTEDYGYNWDKRMTFVTTDLKNVVNFKIDNLVRTTNNADLNESCITLITKGSKVVTSELNKEKETTSKITGHGFEIRFILNWYGENDLRSRFIKALNKLVYYNTLNQPKESF